MTPVPRTSILLPAYNRESYLGAAIGSVLAQTDPDWELIVVDDGSTDRTGAIAAGHAAADPRIRVVRQSNGGIGAARNRALREARGGFIALIDSDDLWMPDKLEVQHAALAADPALDMVFGHYLEFFDPAPDPRSAREPKQGWLAVSLLARRGAFDRAGPFPEGLAVGEFITWFGQAREAGLRAAMLPGVVFHRRIHGGNSVLQGRAALKDYPRALKAVLDRRRAAP